MPALSQLYRFAWEFEGINLISQLAGIYAVHGL